MKRLLVLAVTLFVSCKKEGPQGPAGPQGPPGQDLTRPKEGYIRGYVSGKSEDAKPFRIDYTYEYYYSLSAIATPLDANRIKFELYRTDSIGLGYISLEFTWNKNTNAISDSSISGYIAAQQSGGNWLAYEIRFLNPIPFTSFNGTPLQVYNVQYQNGRLKGNFMHIHPAYDVFNTTNTYPDTLRGEFDVKVSEVQVVSRQARDPQKATSTD